MIFILRHGGKIKVLSVYILYVVSYSSNTIRHHYTAQQKFRLESGPDHLVPIISTLEKKLKVYLGGKNGPKMILENISQSFLNFFDNIITE